MIIHNLLKDYSNNRCIEVWNEIAFIKYNQLENGEKAIINSIIGEALTRIDHNIHLLFKVLRKGGYVYMNYGNLNSTNQPYLLKKYDDYDSRVNAFYTKESSDGFVPLFFASFCSYFKVIDFRGYFRNSDVNLYLDPFFIESIDNQTEVEQLIFKLQFKDHLVNSFLFTPDHYIKVDESGDLGACILLSNDLTIDNYVINYYDDFAFTFMDYLRFCFHWICFPNLYWATAAEQKFFQDMIFEVRKNLKPF